jgi:hypothetical protein
MSGLEIYDRRITYLQYRLILFQIATIRLY